MRAAGKSIYYFGFYLIFMSLTLIFIPNRLLGLFMFEESTQVWPRVVGLLAGLLGFYYIQAARLGLIEFPSLTIPTRLVVFVAFTLFSLFGFAPYTLILFGVVDLAGAAWTYWALKQDQ